MQKTRTQLANLALAHLGKANEAITSYDSATDTSDVFTAITDYYPIAREEVLRSHNWSFNRRCETLVYIDECPTDEWANMFAYPNDCAIIHRIISGDKLETAENKIPYEVASGAGAGTEISISAITETSEGTVLITATAHGFITGDRVTFEDVGGATELNGNYYKVAVVGANTFYILNNDTGVAIAASTITAFTTGGTVEKVGMDRVIYTDTDSTTTQIEYGSLLDESDDDNLPDYPSDYVLAFTYRLAYYLAPRLVSDQKGLVLSMERMYESAMDKARANNNKEPNYGPRPTQSSFVTKRS